jgi:tRNA nucleotidyltransferase/poly(A) polymerase
LNEAQPEKVLARAKQLGILAKLSPSITINNKTGLAFVEARRQFQPGSPPAEIYLGILLYAVEMNELDSLISFLKFPKAPAKSLKDTLNLKACMSALKRPGISNYEIFNVLKEASNAAIRVNSLMQPSTLVKGRLDQFLNQMKSVRTSLQGQDLIKAGLPQGQQVHGILEMLFAARLNGEIETVLEEKQLAQKLCQADFGIDLAFD